MGKRGGWSVDERQGGPFNNPFAALAPAAETDDTPAAVDTAPERGAVSAEVECPKKVHLRQERKGRGGKTVTVVGGLGLGAASLAAWARQVRQALGCGASVEGETLVVQGDQRERLRDFWQARGVRVSGA